MTTVDGAQSVSSRLCRTDGTELPRSGDLWLARVDAVDAAVLDRAVGPVIDLGCGPGRHSQALAERGVVVLGIDLSKHAIGLARSKGVSVLERSIFESIPRAGHWETALLLDGNIGIGGDPAKLLHRAGELLSPTGRLLVEVNDKTEENMTVYLEISGEAGPSFEWASVGKDDLASVAGDAGLTVTEAWTIDGRHFALLKASQR